jgi:serine/threonine protein kinase
VAAGAKELRRAVPAIRRTASIDVERLGKLTQIGRGGQGRVFAIHGSNMAYKEYSAAALPDVNVDALEAAVALTAGLHPRVARQLYTRTTWPVATVERRGRVVGFLMRAVPEAFRVQLALPTGPTRRLAGVQYLLNGEDYLAERGLWFTDRMRWELLRDTASTLDMLHRLGIAVGDLSPNNLLFSLTSRPRCLFIDCDGMRLNGRSILPQSETPDWDVGALDGEELATPATDTYKFALLAIRLFAGDQLSRDAEVLAPPGQISLSYGAEPALDDGSVTGRASEGSGAHRAVLADLARRGMDSNPNARPAPCDWIPALDAALAAESPRLSALPSPQNSRQRGQPSNRRERGQRLTPHPRSRQERGQRLAPQPRSRRVTVAIVVAVLALAVLLLLASVVVHRPSARVAVVATGHPTRAALVDVSAVATDDRTPGLAAMFDTYFSSINAEQYDRAIAMYDPAGGISSTSFRQRQKFRDELSGTHIADVRLLSIGAGNAAPVVAVASVAYRSTQPDGKGPAGRKHETCTRWTVAYELSSATPAQYRMLHTKPNSTPC